MSISIVIVTYNSSIYMKRLLESIWIQQYKNTIEVVIIDNNSKDQDILREIINNFKKDKDRIEIQIKYLKINQGFGASCNLGASFSKYSNLLFINPDTQLYRNSISLLTNHAKINNADICGGKCIYSSSTKLHRTVFNVPTIRTMLFEFSNLGKILKFSGNFYLNQNNLNRDNMVGGVSGAYLLISKENFNRLGGFDKGIFMYLEDVDLCERAKHLQFKILYCSHSKIRHIGGASSKNKYKINQKAWFESRNYYAKKHFSFLSYLMLKSIYWFEEKILNIREKYSTT